MLPKAYMNWCGGKACMLALYYAVAPKSSSVECLLTTMAGDQDRVSMHGVPGSLLEAQAERLGLPLVRVDMPPQPVMEEYERIMVEKLSMLKENGFREAIFGDIFLEDLRKYREEKLATIGIQAVFPLWKLDTAALVQDFIQLGFKAVVVCVNEKYLDKSFCGRLIDDTFMCDLPAGVDPCGENGEFHSFVFDGPIFETAVEFTRGDVFCREYRSPNIGTNAGQGYQNSVEKHDRFWYCDLEKW